MIIKEELITPFLAKQLLEKNTNNRNPKKASVIRYSEDIINGRWKIGTGETIKVSKTGKIIDGQHRLLAVVKANIPVSFTIAYDVDDDVMDVLDTGTKRSAFDVFHIKNIKNSNSIPSMIVFHNNLKNGTSTIGGSLNLRLTNSQILSKYNERPVFWQMVAQKTFVWYHHFAMIIQPSFIGGLYSIFHEINEVDSDEFMNQFCEGTGIKNTTILMLRNKLIHDKVSIRKMNQSLKLALILKTWNCFREGKELKILKFDSEREEYPKAL